MWQYSSYECGWAHCQQDFFDVCIIIKEELIEDSFVFFFIHYNDNTQIPVNTLY